MHEHTREKRPSHGAFSTSRRNAPAREGIEARRDRLLDVLRVVVPALPDTVALNGREFKIVDPKTLAEEHGFHPLQILNDLRDLNDLELIGFGRATIPTGKPGKYRPAWVVRLL